MEKIAHLRLEESAVKPWLSGENRDYRGRGVFSRVFEGVGALQV